MKRRVPPLFLWHRWLGLAVALFAVVLSVTGLMLNHTGALRLDERRVQAPWLLHLYGIEPPGLVGAYRVGVHWITQWGDRLFLDARPVKSTGPVYGACEAAGLLAVAGEDQLILLGPRGELVERLSMPGLRSVGAAAGGALVVRTDKGLLRADGQLIQWSAVSGTADVTWSQPDSAGPPDALLRGIEAHLQGEGLPLERVVLDVHSGRILGPIGVVRMDGAAAVLLFSAVSGVWLWLRHRLRRRTRR
jgi:hypothetical protein